MNGLTNVVDKSAVASLHDLGRDLGLAWVTMLKSCTTFLLASNVNLNN